jgi:hypothetical protein
VCRAWSSSYSSAKVAKRVAQGLCRTGAKHGPAVGTTYCAACLEKMAAREAKLVARGLCRAGAGHGPVVEGKTLCAACLEKMAARKAKYAAQGLNAMYLAKRRLRALRDRVTESRKGEV